MMGNLDNLTDAQLTKLAAKAFRLGLEHGRQLPGPLGAGAVLSHLGITTCRIVHRRKIRQVYGAGYDITRTLRFAGGRP